MRGFRRRRGIMLDWVESGMRMKPEEIMTRIECVMYGALEKSARAFSSLQIH